MTKHKYQLPSFLKHRCTPAAYRKWLDRKARAHVTRDRRRGNSSATRAAYVAEIHRAVLDSRGCDAYTGLPLRWEDISKYDNTASKEGGRHYKKKFADLPTVDHVGDSRAALRFRICSWRVNDSKHDLLYPEFVRLCKEVLDYWGHAENRRK